MADSVTVVARRGKVVQFETCGMIDIKAKKLMKRDKVFRIHWVSKLSVVVTAYFMGPSPC